MELLINCVMLAVLVWMLYHRLPPLILSPVYILITIYILVFVAGGSIYDPTYGGAATGTKLDVSPSESNQLATQVIWILDAFALGAFVSPRLGGTRAVRGKTYSTPLVSRLTTFQATTALFIAGFAMLLMILGTGITNVIQRSDYMTETYHTVKIIGYALLPPGVLAIGSAFTSRSPMIRAVSVMLALASAVLTAALSTRIFAIVPALFFIGAIIIDTKRKVLKIGLAVALSCTPFLVAVPLAGRALDKQGLSALPELVAQVLAVDLNNTLHEALNNVFCAQAETVASARAEVADPFGYVLTGVNPLPGFMTNWRDIERVIGRSMPFGCVGDLLRAGTWVGMCYFALVGLYFGRIDRKIRGSQQLSISLFAQVALSYMFIALSLQYPLRTSSRLIYYMIVIELAVAFITKIAATMARRKRRTFRAHIGDFPRAVSRQNAEVPSHS